MKSWEDEARQLRELIDDLSNRVDQLLADAPIDNLSAVFRIETVTGTNPLTYYTATAITVGGTESEGSTATTADVGRTTIAGLGTKMPTPGVFVVAAMVPNRWVCIYNG